MILYLTNILIDRFIHVEQITFGSITSISGGPVTKVGCGGQVSRAWQGGEIHLAQRLQEFNQ